MGTSDDMARTLTEIARRLTVHTAVLMIVLGISLGASGARSHAQPGPAATPSSPARPVLTTVGPMPTSCHGVTIPPGTEIQRVVGSGSAGTTYCLQPGLYRLTQPIVPKAGDSFVGQPGTILSGAKVITEWTQSGRVWVATGQAQKSPLSWRPTWPPIGNPTAQYNEDVFFDGMPLKRVLSLSDVRPGTFYFDYDGERIYLGDDPSGHTIEGSATSDAIQSRAGRVTVRNLTIEKFTAHGIDVGRDSLIAHNEVRFVHQAGIRFAGGTQVVNNYVHHIGALGLAGSGDQALVEGNEVAFNNAADYRTIRGGCWTAGGSKWVHTDHLVVRNNYTHHNYCDGFWSDIDNINTLYENNRFENNHRAGLFIEISYATTIRHNTFTGNMAAGIFINSSSDQEIYGNILLVNGAGMPASGIPIPASSRGGILIIQQNRGSGRYGPHLAQHISVHDNTICITTGLTGAMGLPQVFHQNNHFEHNRYLVPTTGGTWWTWQGSLRTWSQWQSDGQDTRGTLRSAARCQ